MRLERMIAIIMMLLQKEKTKARELAEQFEVSVRTIYRDISSINNAGVPITSQSGADGGIWIMPEYKISKGIFTKEDLISILTGTGAISSAFAVSEILPTINKVKSLIPSEFQDEINRRSDIVSFNFDIRDGESLKEMLDLLNLAITAKNMVEFYYWSSKGEETSRKIEPYRIIFNTGHWYIWGYCLERCDYRTFKLSRMWNVLVDETPFEQRNPPSAFIDVDKSISEKAITIELLVDYTILDRVLDHCSNEKITKISDTKYKVDFCFIESDYDYGILLSFGDKCQCISPDFVREGLKSRIKEALEKYDAP